MALAVFELAAEFRFFIDDDSSINFGLGNL
jgi:hypothetical protein